MIGIKLIIITIKIFEMNNYLVVSGKNLELKIFFFPVILSLSHVIINMISTRNLHGR